MRFDRVLRLLCLASLLLLLAGCARRSDTQAVILITPAPTETPNATPAPTALVGGGSYVYGAGPSLNVGYVGKQGASFHPLRSDSRDLTSLDRLVFESVVDLDENRAPVAQLCDRWEFD